MVAPLFQAQSQKIKKNIGGGGEYLVTSIFFFRPKNRSGTGLRLHGIPWPLPCFLTWLCPQTLARRLSLSLVLPWLWPWPWLWTFIDHDHDQWPRTQSWPESRECRTKVHHPALNYKKYIIYCPNNNIFLTYIFFSCLSSKGKHQALLYTTEVPC